MPRLLTVSVVRRYPSWTVARHTADLLERYLDHLQDMAHIKFSVRSTKGFVVRDPVSWEVCSGVSSSVVIQQAMTTSTLLR